MVYVYVSFSLYIIVGYGDIVATTRLGRVFACVFMATGVLLLALPVGVIGSKFVKLYNEDAARRKEQRLALARYKEEVRMQLMAELQRAGSQSSRKHIEREQSKLSQMSLSPKLMSTKMLSGVVLHSTSSNVSVVPSEVPTDKPLSQFSTEEYKE